MKDWATHFKEALASSNLDYELRGNQVIIRYEDFIIKNSRKQTAPISELFVKVEFTGDRVTSIQGMRMKFREVDISNGYSHSHLPGSSIGHFENFCLGSGEIKNFFDARSFQNTPEQATMFLFLLDLVVKWESLEGRPHMYIEKLITREVTPMTDGQAENVLVNGKLPIKSDVIDFTIIDNKVVVSEAWIREQLAPNCVAIDGVYYPLASRDSNGRDNVKYFTDYYKSRFSPFKFKGQHHEFTVTPNKDLSKDTVAVIHPKTIEAYGSRISKELTKYLLNKED